jgi:hypothetical protein
LEITVSFLGIHKGEPDIYIGFSPALHLQCRLHRLAEFIPLNRFLGSINVKNMGSGQELRRKKLELGRWY